MKRVFVWILAMIMFVSAASAESQIIADTETYTMYMQTVKNSTTAMLKVVLKFNSEVYDRAFPPAPNALTNMVDQIFEAVIQTDVDLFYTVITNDGVVKYVSLNGEDVTWSIQPVSE